MFRSSDAVHLLVVKKSSTFHVFSASYDLEKRTLRPMSNYTKITLEDFQAKLGSAGTELSSVSLGGRVISCSDEFFADASNLVKVGPALSMKGQFGPQGALFDGWESKRHNPTYDWAIIKLGAPGYLIGFDIDTANFNGNEAPQASIEALFSTGGDPGAKDEKWKEVLPRVDLGPSSRHLFKIDQITESYTHLKLNMYPDGGIRSRVPGHKDWAIIKLGAPGYLQEVEIDTAHFKGNFPESCDLYATNTDQDLPSEDDFWNPILARRKLRAHHQHVFELENTEQVYTHVRLTIYPDGGVKRVRLIGRRAEDSSESSSARKNTPTAVAQVPEQAPSTSVNSGNHHYVSSAELAAMNDLSGNGTEPPTPSALPGSVTKHVSAVKGGVITITAMPLTHEAYAAYGDVIQAYSPTTSAPAQVKVTSANQGSAHKFHRLSPIVSSYPADVASQAVTAISVFRSTPVGAKLGEDWPVKLLERHPHTSQAFVPMGTGGGLNTTGTSRLDGPGRAYLVIVALNGGDDKPDLSTLRAFVATTAQGVSYSQGVWHHPMISLESAIDFACIETQIGDVGNQLDCEILELEPAGLAVPIVKVPVM
ncbi:Allantoicase [Tulasnella sp. JGI-2019a]|nr:Allantoicase [Tulasnella sp. JGI-2019a]